MHGMVYSQSYFTIPQYVSAPKTVRSTSHTATVKTGFGITENEYPC